MRWIHLPNSGKLENLTATSKWENELGRVKLCSYKKNFYTVLLMIIDTGTTRRPSAGHRVKANQKHFSKKLFTTNPLGALFTKSRRGMLGNYLHIDWLTSQCLLELPQSYAALSDSVMFQSGERARRAALNGINNSRDLGISASTG